MTQVIIDRATLEQLVVALEGVAALIEHQYTGTREGMNALQNASDDAQVALNKLRAALANAERVEQVPNLRCNKVRAAHMMIYPRTCAECGITGRCEVKL